ncbi:MAG: putative nucleic acid-binding Zn-ribbon protein [Myxococcota bacterium]
MRETLQKLIALQAIDDEARGFKQEREDLTAKIVQLKKLLGLMEVGLAEKTAKLNEATKWYQEKNEELQGDKGKVDKAKVRLQAVTKNKEYMAMQREIEGLRKQIIEREDEITSLATAIQEFKESVSAEKSKMSKLNKEVASEEKDNATRIVQLDSSIAKVEANKGDISKSVKPNILSRFRRISKARDGIAIVPARNKSCSACNFAVPAQQLVRLQIGNTMEVCRNCSRMMYWRAPEVDPNADSEAAAPA